MKATTVVFPGQGAQFVGMGQDLLDLDPAYGRLMTRAGEILGYDLKALCANGPEDNLTKSNHAQPAIFVVSIICYLAWLKMPGHTVHFFAGLSSGEWAALHAAGVVTFEDAIRILEARGRFMQETCLLKPGAMLSVMTLDPATLAAVSEKAGVEMANFNSPEQTVLSGTVEGITRAETLAKEAGARRAIRLNVAGAFHSSLMQPAAARLAEYLESVKFSDPKVPVISNVTARPHTNAAEIKRLMIQQVTSSVRWVESIQWLSQQGVGRYVECGPGKVLSGLIKRIDKQAETYSIQDRSSLDNCKNSEGT